LIALNNTLFVFLIWALPRSAAVLAAALGLSSAFLLLRMLSLLPSRDAAFQKLKERWTRLPKDFEKGPWRGREHVVKVTDGGRVRCGQRRQEVAED
jgi:hypothetical protein